MKPEGRARTRPPGAGLVGVALAHGLLIATPLAAASESLDEAISGLPTLFFPNLSGAEFEALSDEEIGLSAPLSVMPDEYPRRYQSNAKEAYYRVIGTGMSAADIDRDGDIDLIFPGGPNSADRVLFNQLNDSGELRFEMLELDTPAAPFRRSVVSADIDGDGLHELIFHGDDGAQGEPGAIILWSADDWSYASATPLPDTGAAATGSVLADPLGDGLLRLIRVSWAMEKATDAGLVQQTVPSEAYTSVQTLFADGFDEPVGPTFRELIALNGTLFTVAIADLDGSPPHEIVITRDLSHNLFFARDTERVYRDQRSEYGILVRGSNMGLAIADIDQDDDPDVFATQIFNVIWGIVMGHRNRLFINDEDESGALRFAEDTLLRGISATDWAWSAFFRDLNNDGLLDLVVASGGAGFPEFYSGDEHPVSYTPNHLFVNTGIATFIPVHGTPLDDEHNTRVVLPADLDRDGRLDLVELHLDRSVRVLRNTTPEVSPTLQLLLEPPVAARGATLRVRVGDTLIRRDLVAGEGYLTQAPDEIHVVIPASAPDDFEAEIRWAQGSHTLLRGLPRAGTQRLRRPICDGAGVCTTTPGWSCLQRAPDSADTTCTLISALSLEEQYASTPSEPTPPTREEMLARIDDDESSEPPDDTGDGNSGDDSADDAGFEDADSDTSDAAPDYLDDEAHEDVAAPDSGADAGQSGETLGSDGGAGGGCVSAGVGGECRTLGLASSVSLIFLILLILRTKTTSSIAKSRESAA